MNETGDVQREDVQAPTPIYVSQLDACPSCGEEWLYGEEGRFSRVVGVYDVRLDRTVAWRCPDCGQEWDRNARATVFGSRGSEDAC